MNKDQRLELCLHALESNKTTLDVCLETSLAGDPEAAAMLRTIWALRQASVPEAESEAARCRVRARLLDDIGSADPPGLDAQSAAPRRPHAQPRRPRPITRRLLGIAAALLFCVLVTQQALVASANALPGAPLYAVKRGQEWVTLHAARSDEQRGQALAMIASHRLAEARAEASLNNTAQVRALIAELDASIHELIRLTATMTERHEDTIAVAAALARTLNDEYAALTDARNAGQSVFVQELGGITASQRQAIAQSNLALPGASGIPTVPPGTDSTVAPTGTPSSHHSSASPSPGATHSPTATPGNGDPGSSGGNGGGGNGGGGNGGSSGSGGGGAGQGHGGVPSPTPTPGTGASTQMPHARNTESEPTHDD